MRENQYWVKDESDAHDLPQPGTAGARTFYVQGYQAPSRQKDDLSLEVSGLAQAETCFSYQSFLQCSPCSGGASPVTLAWQVSDVERFDSVFPVEFDLDGPEAKYFEEIPEPIEVAADNVAADYLTDGPVEGYWGPGYLSRINFSAYVDWDLGEVHPDYLDPVPDAQELRLDWHVSALGNEAGFANHCTAPALRDLEDPLAQEDNSGKITALARALASTVQLTFKHAGDGRARAGDRFCIVPHGQLSDPSVGGRFWDRHTVVVRPGDKAYHISVPRPEDRPAWFDPAAFDPAVVFDMTDGDFQQAFGAFKWMPPLGSREVGQATVFLFDRFRNPLSTGRPFAWTVDGGGRLSHEPIEQEPLDDPPLPEAPADSDELAGETGPRGEAEVWFQQHRYPNCPWQASDGPRPTLLALAVDGANDDVTHSLVQLDLPQPADPPRPAMRIDYVGAVALDIDDDDTGEIRAILTRGGIPLPGLPVTFASVNGALAQEVAWTDELGAAAVTLTPAGARLDHERTDPVLGATKNAGIILVTASVGDLRGQVGTDVCPTGQTSCLVETLPRWVDRSQLSLSVEHDVLVSDRAGSDYYQVETLDETYETLFDPSAVPGDGLIGMPLFRETRVVIHGEPLHTYRVEVSKPAGVPPPQGDEGLVHARYPFDTQTAGFTPGVPASSVVPPAQVGTVGVSADAIAGSSFSFNGTSNSFVYVYEQPAVHPETGLQVTFWIKPSALANAVLVQRSPGDGSAPDDYRIELLSSGHLRLSAGPNQASVTTDAVVTAGVWTYVEARFTASFAKIGIGPDPGNIDAAFTNNAPGLLVSHSWPVFVACGAYAGQGCYSGLIDELDFARGGFEPEEVDLLTVDPGAPPGEGQPIGVLSDNLVTTDASGRAEFFFRLIPQAGPKLDTYLPVSYEITVYGSRQAKVEVNALPGSWWSELLAAGRAFLLGEESLPPNAGWLQRAAAWVSGILPIISDLRTLCFEAYKAASGCDQVSAANVTFSLVGVLLDAASFGTAGSALRTAKAALLPLCRQILKEVAASGALDVAVRAALSTYIDLMNAELAAAEEEERPAAAWVSVSQELLGRIQGWTAVFEDAVEQLFRSPLDFLAAAEVWSSLYVPGVLDDPVGEVLSVVDEIDAILGDYDPNAQGSVWPRSPLFIGGGFLGTLGDLERRVLELRVGAVSWTRERALRQYSSGVLRQVFDAKNAWSSIAWSSSPTARRGLQALTLLVVHGAQRNAKAAKVLSSRLRKSLRRLDSDASRKTFLEDFEELYQFAKQDPDVLLKLEGVAVNFASKATTASAGASHTKGAAMQVQLLADAKRAGKLALDPDSVEPLAKALDPTKGLRAWWDFRETLGALIRNIEAKNWTTFSGKSKKVGRQMGKNYARDPAWGSAAPGAQISAVLKPSVVKYPAAADVPPNLETIRDEIVPWIMKKQKFRGLGWKEEDVKAWLEAKIQKEAVVLRYTSN